ncbi:MULTISPECIES: phosphate ABC transporter permease PstA [unclassified Yoonia]|uniref:phosphate ABC transporter permease PstA n=1 Tax=unclassified Yoonia TaxID=2629118 RepID=UPI002AFE47C4|nr:MULTISPECIES: phosphate ABC transporter permease PstA [unclassified Yoonia]
MVDSPNTGIPAPHQISLTDRSPAIARRKRKDVLLQGLGLVAISIAFAVMFLLFASLIRTGHTAFVQTHITLDVFIDPAEVPVENLPRGGFQNVVTNAMIAKLPSVDDDSERRAVQQILSNGAQFYVRDRVVADPSLIGQTISITVPASDAFDQLHKGSINRDTPEALRRVNDQAVGWWDELVDAGAISKPLNFSLITNADSRFPELAGLRGALVGSFWALLICFIIAFPAGIGAAIYLEEFAPKNKVSDFIEVNINNLAAVPSVVFGLLALAVFLNYLGMPRSAPFVGGLTLALMTMPTIIIATRAALKAVPPSIREAALGVGASKQQVVFQHVLPLAMPGILTGTIIGLAQALGETAPLLLIGMNAFITSAASSPFEAATALPTQIFIWADSPERGFVSRTSAAILVLLTFLIFMNGIAIYMRSKFERRW